MIACERLLSFCKKDPRTEYCLFPQRACSNITWQYLQVHVLHACLVVFRQAKVDAASLDRLFMQAYDFKHLSLDLYIVRTNLNPRTIMRSPGFINSVMVTPTTFCPISFCPRAKCAVWSCDLYPAHSA